MSITSALNTVQNIFNNTGYQSSVVSTNISNSGNSDYVRREASVTSTSNPANTLRTCATASSTVRFGAKR